VWCSLFFFSPHVELLCVEYIAHTGLLYDGYIPRICIIALFLRGRHVYGAAGQCLLIRHKRATGRAAAMLFNKTIIVGPLYLTNQLVSRLALQLLGEYFTQKREKKGK
jgi:hypothetical protein